MIKSGIYMLKNKINGKIYIGKAKDIEFRWERHRKSVTLKNVKAAIKNAIIKYGWDNFEKTVIEYVEDISKLVEKEGYWIKFYNATNKEIGYNYLKQGTDWTGFHHSEESKQKMSKNMIGKYVGEKNPMFGKHHTSETKQKISDHHKEYYSIKENVPFLGKHHSIEGKKQMSEDKRDKHGKCAKQINIKTGEIIKIWDCITTATRELTGKYYKSNGRLFNSAAIYNVCNKRSDGKGSMHRTAYGFYWEYATKEEFDEWNRKTLIEVNPLGSDLTNNC